MLLKNKIAIVAIGKLKEPYKSLQNEFLKRLNFVKIIEIRESNKEKETKDVIKKLKEINSFKILCDVKGKLIDENCFDRLLSRENVTFIIGGCDGFTKEIYNYVNESISFSKLTFNHQLFRIILLEQIYRWYCKLKKHPYGKH